MPNYRKKKQSNNNKRNKNKSQNQNKNNSSSLLVQQDVLSESESVGIEPNLPADECFSRIGIERDFAIVDNASSTSNNGEIDGIACNVDIDTIKQSNCSSSFYSSSTTKKSIATIDRQSERTAFDGDSTIGSSTLSDEFAAGTGINSLKTGSAQTKDAEVSTATEQSAALVTDTSRITSVSGEKYESGSKEIRNTRTRTRTRKSGINDDRARPLIVHDFAKDSSQTGEVSEENNNSKVIRQECHQSETIKTASTSQDESHFKYVSVQQSPQDEHLKVIVQHFFEDETTPQSEKTKTKVTVQESPQEKSKVITQRVEETRTTSHTASKKISDHPSEVIVQKTTKRKVSRTTTSALPSTRSAEDPTDSDQTDTDKSHKRSSSANSRKLAKISIQHVSREDATQPVDYYINPPVEHAWETSTVIVHPISFEDSSEESSSLPNAAEDAVNVIAHPVPQDSSNQRPEENAKTDRTSKEVIHSISQENQKECSEVHQHSIGEEGHSPKVVVIPIVLENPSQTSIPEDSCYQKKEPPIFFEYSSFPEFIDQRRSPASIDGDNLEADVVFEPLSRERSPESSSSTNSIPAEGSEPLTLVIVDPIIQERSTPSITIPPARADTENLWERPNSPSTTEETTDHITPTTSFPVCRSPKGIVHQIHRHAPTEPVFPLTPASLEKLDQSSKIIAHQILEDVSSELQSSFRADKQNRTLQNEPGRKTFPVTNAGRGPTRPGFFETNIFETEPNPVDVEAKVIIHPIFQEDSPGKQSISIQTEVDSNQQDPKKINDQLPIQRGRTSEVIISLVSREISKSTESKSIDKVNGDESINEYHKSEVIVHDISKDSNQTDQADQLQNLASSASLFNKEKKGECSTIFPLSSKNSKQFSKEPTPIPSIFPLTTYIENYPAQYTSPQNFESKGGDLDFLRERSDLRQSSSTLTSPFALTITDARVHNESAQTTQKILTNLEALTTVFPISAGKTETGSLPQSIPSFPVILEEPQKQSKPALNSDQTSKGIVSEIASKSCSTTEPKIIEHPIRQEDKTQKLSPIFPLSPKNSTQLTQPKTIASEEPTPIQMVFPLTTYKQNYPAQYTSPQTFESKGGDLDFLRERSDLRQSSSTLTSPFAVTITDPRVQKVSSQTINRSSTTSSSPLTAFPISAVKTYQQKKPKTKTGSVPQSPQSFPIPVHLASSAINTETIKETLSPSDLQPKVIVHEVVIPPDDSTPSSPITDTQLPDIDRQSSQEDTSSSSDRSDLTAIHVLATQSTPQPLSPEDQKEKSKSPHEDQKEKPKSPRSSFFLTSLQLSNQFKDQGSNSEVIHKESNSQEMSSPQEETRSPKVIVQEVSREDEITLAPKVAARTVITHPTAREKTPPDVGRTTLHPLEKPLGYRVDSPQPDVRLAVMKKSKSLDDEDLVIQEMSDASSAGDTDNPPVVSEAESETDTLEAVDDFPDTPTSAHLVSIQTLPIDHVDETTDQTSLKTSQEYKIRRQQNRVALETHFLPQFLSPIFLDSIKEENSDLSDSDRRSEGSDRNDHTHHEGDALHEDGLHAKNADAVFPKSNLDFSKKHKHIHTNVRPQNVIREEAPPPSVVEAKIIDHVPIEEGCGSWSTNITPECDTAEVVYIDSASSSVSDLLELDYSQGQSDETIDVRIQTPTIDLESVNEMFSDHQSESNERIKATSPPPSLPPVKEEENISEQILLPPLTASDRVETTKTEITTTAPNESPDEIILEKIETVSQAVAVAADDDRVVDCATIVEHAQNSKANSPNSCDSAINQVVTNDKSSVAAVGVIEKKMENIREIVSASSQQSELDTITDVDHDILKPNFKIGEPCSHHTFKCDTITTNNTTPSANSLCTSSITTTSTITTSNTATQILTLHDLSKSPGDAQHLHPLGVSYSALDRQGSLDSHGSDQSHSTNQSQCTAINQGSLPHSDWNEFDTTADTSYVSGSDTAGLASSENSSPITTKSEAARSADATDLPPVKKLRSLCTEALASMPYGEEVLEELATVAQNIGDMPYPLPEIPHIRDIQVSLQSEPQQKSSTITLTQVPPSPKSTPAMGQKLRTPPPPPVPEPPSKYDSWLGVPTESDPNVLVCLSPSQRTAVKNDTTPDSLLDMHKKFVERRGYHEYTTSQVKAMNKENSYETVKLSKSNSPPPPTSAPPPPKPPLNGSETAPPTDLDADDQNNHLSLLAIIRDTHDQQTSTSSTTSFRENISRQTESGPNTISPTHTIKTPNDGGGWENFANPQSVNKQTQERFVSESINQSKNSNDTMQSEQSEQTREHTIKVEHEPVLGLRFPSSDYFDSIFGKNKRFSNIETGSSPGYCSQILSTQPKRYSNIETSTFESRKCVENGKVLYDISDSNKQTVREGEKPDPELTSFPQLGKKPNGFSSFPFISATKDKADLRPKAGDSENIMSEFKLSEQMTAAAPPPPQSSTAPARRVEQSPPAPPVPPLPATLVDTTATTTTKSTSTTETVKNRNFSGETQNEALFDDFRQRAKEAATGEQQSAVRTTTSATTKKSDLFDREKLFKDFDELSNLLNNELESGKRRPPATVDGGAIPAGVSDYKTLARESKIQSSHVSSSTTEHNRREQMKKLADEIDRTSAQRQQTRREMRIPIRVEKPVRDAPEVPLPPRSYEIPVQVEKTTRTEQRTYEVPIRVETGTSTDRETLKRQRSYEIPIRVEHETGTRQRTRSEHQKHHDAAPVRSEKPREQPERFRRAESMFNISEATSSRHKLHDDWMKYVGDLGSSENICKPFQREVEICYRGRRPNIRAPRLSASTSDLSSIHSYDTHGAYDVKRTTTTQTINSQQPPRRRYLSTQSMIDTRPITPCVSSRRSPVRERQSSLPREIHDQQLKYISSKEHQLQIEFERLENERRQLIDEMNRAQINQRINREAYRQRQLPPLTEDESFRQQMAEEWLHKVAEREERRLQKIIKISKINQDSNLPTVPPRRTSASDIGDEFLRRVKERRSKLCMPSDSDWESGAESQPAPRTDGTRSETDEPPIKILEGQSEADLKHLPQHLREFAKLTSQTKEEHREENTENTTSRAIKKSSIVTTVKTSNATNTANTQESLQKDAARVVRDLEQLSQGKRQKLVTILRHKKPAESSSSGGCQPKTEAAIPPTTAGSSGGGGAVKRRKQTRFLLTPNRRSWSESDLLREIDKELVLAKGFLYANGVWTPKNQTPTSSRNNLNEFQPHNTTCPDKIIENRSSSACGHKEKGHNIPTPPPPPLWTPQPERKQFRPVHFESPVLQRRYVRQQSNPSEAPPPPWSYTNSQPFPGYQSQSCSNLSQKSTAIPWPPAVESAVNKNCAAAPTASPVVDDEEEIFTPTTSIAEKIRSFERSTSNSELHRPFLRHNPHEKPAILKPNEVIYSVKNEYMSEPETEYDKPKKMAQLSRRQYDGIGPTTKHGMPVILRSEVKEPNQHEWYKRIFQTIHKQKNPDDYVTIRYKCPRGRYPYKSNGYMSEPEPNYDSDYSTVKYRTLERRHLQSTGTDTGIGSVTARPSSRGPAKDIQDDTVYGTMPNPVKSGQGSYKVQPGRIEDYVTGYSSVSEKEKKEWWDEVMDIFNGQLEQQKLSPQYTEGNLSRALLKEQGYTSDSNLVFRKKDVPQQQSPLSPVEQKQVYKSVQLGGQPPLLGFRKPAPEKPKETEFEYLPITPTLTKIRVHSKEAMSKKRSSETTHAAQRELICYPITNLSRPIDMFAPFPKHVPSFIPMNQPPLPPNRKSSRTRTTSMALRISSSEVRRPTSANSSRHEACFQTKDAVSPPPPRPAKYGTITLRKTVRRTEPLVRSKSAGAVVNASDKEDKSKDARVSRKQQTVRLSACSPVRSASRLSTLRTSSRSPVAFGRSVSKERSFAEEKKRIEETLPSIRTDFTASTNILRDPTLKSPDQVKRAVRSYAFPMERSKSAPRVLSPTKPVQSSYMSTYVVRRVPSPTRKEIPLARKAPTSTSARPAVKTTVVRSKSQSSKLSEKCTSRPMTKTTSTVSLARTSSTFSVDSTASKVKPIPKKPLTINRPTEVDKAKRKPITISSSKSDTNIMRKIKESSEAKQKIAKAIPSQQKLIRTNHFFKNLFMRGLSPSKADDQLRQSSVSEKAKYWNTMSLPIRKSVSDSRHLSYQQCRSLSPPGRPQFVEEYESVEHFQSDDETSEFGDYPGGRTEDLVWQYEQRSRSEPRTARVVTDIARPASPARVFPREFSPTREIRVPQTREMRSPSRRRIQSFRDSQRGDTGKVIRASSLSSADDRSKRSLYNCDEISHSANSLEYIERHTPSCRSKNSNRFIDLNRFYSTLERVGQLERATSATSLKPIRKEGQAIDFEEWRKIRFHERAERELNYLVGRLKEDQKQKDFLFRPKDVEDVKWTETKDLSLRSKDKSVEDLRENFEKKIHQEWLDESKRLELESKKDTYKPYWRGSSVADLASSMEIKFNPDSGSFGIQKVKSESATAEKPLCLSNRLISTLSKDQVSKITQQLHEIYNASEPKAKPDVTEEYVITVDKQSPANALKVRCNSSISKEELIGPVLRRKEAHEKSPPRKTFDRPQEVRKFESELTESEKRRLSQTFSREIQGKARSGSPVMLARETRGAIAAENAKITMPDIPPPPPLPKDLLQTKKPPPSKPKRKIIESKKEPSEGALKIDTITTETIEKPDDTISKKIQYFEDRKFEEPAKTIYHAREDSSPDEDEVMRVIEENIKARAQSEAYRHCELSSSVTDIKDLFGERESSRINFPLPRPPPPPDETIYNETKQDQHRSTSLTLSASRDGSIENLETLFRSRSVSPQPPGHAYLQRVHTGEVRKIKDKFESLGRPKKKKHFFAISPLRKVRSDPELSNDGSKDTFKTVVREHEVGDVSWITHKFEVQTSAGRGRSRIRKPGSPIQRMPLRKEDRLMPHIDIISKTASLKQEMMKSRSPSPVRQQAKLHSGEVERIRCIFETSPDRETVQEQPGLGTSSPELRDISAHLTASWIAHKYPKRLDNDIRSKLPLHEQIAKSLSMPITGIKRHERHFRSRSISPPKSRQKEAKARVTSILKPRFDIFANQKFDPSIHRPKARYVPDSGEDLTKKKPPPSGSKKTSAVKFKDDDEVPPPPVPPTKGVSLDSNGLNNLESPNRYFESDVNIHYKTPIRYEYKDPIPDEELAIRQAETMQKLYQEERRRKYLQELQDMNSRRHTDNFTPSQKSPIPLNRYDDFNSDLAPKSPNNSNYPKTIARALYNFQGQTARELTFKKGDVIYIRRQIDKNWYEGEHNAMIGLLPSNYVEIITKDGIRQPPKRPSEGQARAKYNFQAQSGIELSLNKGEHVTLTRRVDDNWFEGKIANRKGIFPVSYVEVLVDIGADDKVARAPASQSTITQTSLMRPSLDTLRTNINNEFNSLTSNGQPPNGILRETRTLHKTEVLHVDTNTEPIAYRALYKYRPQNTDELELQEGDIVYVLEKCDDGWFVGTSQRSGCFGTFPGNYVERV